MLSSLEGHGCLLTVPLSPLSQAHVGMCGLIDAVCRDKKGLPGGWVHALSWALRHAHIDPHLSPWCMSFCMTSSQGVRCTRDTPVLSQP